MVVEVDFTQYKHDKSKSQNRLMIPTTVSEINLNWSKMSIESQ